MNTKKSDDVNIRIDRNTYRKLKIRAAKNGLTLKALIKELAFA